MYLPTKIHQSWDANMNEIANINNQGPNQQIGNITCLLLSAIHSPPPHPYHSDPNLCVYAEPSQHSQATKPTAGAFSSFKIFSSESSSLVSPTPVAVDIAPAILEGQQSQRCRNNCTKSSRATINPTISSSPSQCQCC